MLRASSEACARFATLTAMLMAPAVFGGESMASALSPEVAKTSRVAPPYNDAYNNFSDPTAFYERFIYQVFNAQLDQTFPTNPLLRVNLGNPQNFNFYQLRSCARADVGKCLQYGNSSNGLPERLQGIWWQDGVIQPEQAISTAGTWDPVRRRLRIDSSGAPVWAFEGSSSTLDKTGRFLLPSGAAHYNFFVTNQLNIDIWLNEDLTFGQIGGGFWGVDPRLVEIASPWLFNWTMEYTPEGSWKRRTVNLGVETALGRYTLRKIIDGNGNPTGAFDEWLKFDDGNPFYYGVKVWP